MDGRDEDRNACALNTVLHVGTEKEAGIYFTAHFHMHFATTVLCIRL